MSGFLLDTSIISELAPGRIVGDGLPEWLRDNRFSIFMPVVAVIEIERTALPAEAAYRAFGPSHVRDAEHQVEVGSAVLGEGSGTPSVTVHRALPSAVLVTIDSTVVWASADGRTARWPD